MPISRLPDDLIYDIVDQLPGLYRLHGIRANEATERELRAQLVACCLASKAFLVRARPLLYDEIVLHFYAYEPVSPRAVGDHDTLDVIQIPRSSAQALSIAINPHLGRLVRRVDLGVVISPHTAIDNNLPALALATTLRNAPNVRELEIKVSYDGAEEGCLTPLYHAITTLQPSIRTLRIVWYPDARNGVAARSPAVFPLLSTLPSLEDLVIYGLYIPSIPSGISCSFTLKILDLMVEGPGSATAFDAITSNSSETLAKLRLGGTFGCDLSRFSALENLVFCLIYDQALIPDSAILEHQVTHDVRDNVGPTVASVSSNLVELQVVDDCRTIPSTAFDTDFFATVPRSIATVAFFSLRLEADAVLGLLGGIEAYHTQSLGLRMVICDREITGDTVAMVARLSDAGVHFSTGNKAEATRNRDAA